MADYEHVKGPQTRADDYDDFRLLVAGIGIPLALMTLVLYTFDLGKPDRIAEVFKGACASAHSLTPSTLFPTPARQCPSGEGGLAGQRAGETQDTLHQSSRWSNKIVFVP